MRLSKSIIIVFISIINIFLLSAQEPILVIDPQGHSAMVWETLFTPDGSMVISVGDDKTIRIWDVETGDLLKTIRGQIHEGHEGKLFCADLSPDGRTLAVAGWLSYAGDEGYGRIRLLDFDTGEQIGLLSGHTSVLNALSFSHDGRILASGGNDNTICIWDVAKQKEIALLTGHEARIQEIVFSPDDRYLVSASFDYTLRMWDIEKSEQIAIMEEHYAEVRCVDWSPDGKYLVSGGYDGGILLWNYRGRFIKEIDTYPDHVVTVSFSADSKRVVASGSGYYEAIVYDILSSKQISVFTGHKNTVLDSDFYNNELIATCGGNDNEIFIWDANTAKEKNKLVGQGRLLWTVGFGPELNIAFGYTLNEKTSENYYGEFEKAFDFANMTLYQELPQNVKYSRVIEKHLRKEFIIKDDYTLEIKGGGVIENDYSVDGWIRCYSFTKTGDVVLGSDYSLKLYKSDGSYIREYVGHTSEIWAVSISEEGRFLVSASGDQTIRLWNIKSGECLLTLFVGNDNEWVCWTPQGYYTASAGGEKYIGWQINRGIEKTASYFPVYSFRKRFYNPELVVRTAELGSFEMAFTEVNSSLEQKIDKVSIMQTLPPEITWITPEDIRTEVRSSDYQIKAKIKSNTEYNGIKILVNGRAIVNVRGIQIKAKRDSLNNYVYDLSNSIQLAAGENEIAIFAENQDASVTSDKRVVIYNAPKDEVEEWLKPNLYMISVGISTYKNSDLSLDFPDDDAMAMSNIFKTQKGKLYKDVQIKELYNEKATQDNILSSLDWLEKNATQKDVVVIFIASHGVKDSHGNYYILPADGDPDKLRQTGVNWRDFSDVLGNLPSKVLLFLDTCHSGQMGSNMFVMRGVNDNTDAIRELSSDENGVVIMAASTGKEYSMEHPDWGHGAYTLALIEGLEKQKADYSGDGIIYLRELDVYVSERVKELTGGEQHSTTQKPSTISRFPIIQK